MRRSLASRSVNGDVVSNAFCRRTADTSNNAPGLKCAARGSLEIQDAKKSPSAHHRIILSGDIFVTKAQIRHILTIGKKLVK